MQLDGASFPVQLRGLRRGSDVGGPALVWATEDGLAIAADRLRRPIAVRFGELDGVVAHVGDGATPVPTLVLYLADGDVLEVEGDERVAVLAAELVRRATTFPEVTRGLRAVGTRRGDPGEDHDRFFAPLLDARARAEQASGWEAQLDAFGAEVLRERWARSLVALAAQRHPESAPDRRALEAVLDEAIEGAGLCLGRVEAAAAAVREADDATRLAHWRHWAAEVGRLFGEADRCWLAALRELADSPAVAPAPPPRPGLWRRLRGR